ncbi:MAG: AraC family transcriptional regulator [Porticoccaceae bacterium]|nr:AraC family transcriptional regulator [Porticoccaceae bacterium]
MSSIQVQSFHTEDHFVSNLDSQVTGPGYDIEAHHLQLPSTGTGIYHSETHCFLQLVMVPGHILQGTYPCWHQNRSVGQLVFVPPGATLEWHWASGSQRTVTCMFEVDKIGALGAYDWDWREVDLYKTLDIRNDYLVMGMRKLWQEARSPGFASELQIESTLTLMALELRKNFMKRTVNAEPARHRLADSKLRSIRDYIHANLGKGLALSDIAESNGLSSRALSELFRNTTGITIREFIANARLSKAKALLANRELLIKQVGYDCGFRGAAAFVAAFRKATGMTPTEYRQRFCL